jgi:hypothetical protein
MRDQMKLTNRISCASRDETNETKAILVQNDAERVLEKHEDFEQQNLLVHVETLKKKYEFSNVDRRNVFLFDLQLNVLDVV